MGGTTNTCLGEDDFLGLLAGELHFPDVQQHLDSCDRCRRTLVELIRGQRDLEVADAEQLPVIDPGHYRIEGEFARGGLGAILKARDRRLGRVVALKQLHAPNPAAEMRLKREALVTARLQHPAIVPVYEAGRWPTGETFYAMKLVSGRSLASIIADAQSLDERLALLPHILAVAKAIAYAHGEGVIHRDLKPANVVIGFFGETVIIDWGLAKVIGRDTRESMLQSMPDSLEALTVTGAVMGTPAYMPPEQASAEDIDGRADVYAIGAMLYHLLAGAPPYQGTTREILAKVLSLPPPPIEARQPGVPEDLATVVHKAMARAPADRYPTAMELARDLENFQTGRLVGAHRYSPRALMGRFIARNRKWVAVATGLVIIAALTAIASFVRVRRARDVAESRANELVLAQARAMLDHDPTATLAWIKSYPRNGKEQTRARDLAIAAVGRGVSRVVLRSERGYSKIKFSPDGRFLATAGRVWELPSNKEHVLESAGGDWTEPFFTDQWIVAGGQGGQIRLWSLRAWTSRTLHGRGGDWVYSAPFPDGKRILSYGENSLVQMWDLETGSHRVLFDTESLGAGVAISADGKRFAVVDEKGIIWTWSGADEAPRVRRGHQGGSYSGVAFTPDGKRLVSGSDDGTVRVWEMDSDAGRVLLRHDRRCWHIAISPDGTQVASGWYDGGVAVTTLATGATRWLRAHNRGVHALAFSPDGKTLASGGFDRTVRLWNLASGTARVLEGHQDFVIDLAFSPDGRTLASRGLDGTVRLWSAIEPAEIVPLGGDPIAVAAHSGDGRWFAIGSLTGGIRIFDRTMETTRELHGHGVDTISSLEFSPDGTQLVSAALDGKVWLWQTATGQGRLLGELGAGEARATISADGRTVAASGGRDHALVVWLLSDGALQLRSNTDTATIAIALTPDASALITGTMSGKLSAWDLATHAERVLAKESEAIAAIQFSPDGRWLASAAGNNVRLTERASGASRLLRGHDGLVNGVLFSPQGPWLASAGSDRCIWLWDTRTGHGRRLVGPERSVQWLAFSPDGTRLASSAFFEDSVWLWDVALGIGRRILPGHSPGVRDLAFAPDGRRLITVSPDTLRAWALAPELEVPAVGELRGWLDAQTDARISADNRLE